MAASHSDTLQQFFPELLKYLDFATIYPYLVSERLLTLPELEKLNKYSGERDTQIRLLVSTLVSKGRGSYPLFLKALERSVESDDLSLHLGHLELLQILPKSCKTKPTNAQWQSSSLNASITASLCSEEENDKLTGSLREMRLSYSQRQSRLPSGDDLTDSGLTDSFSKARESWDELERNVKDLNRRNQELQRENEQLQINMMRERKEVQYCMQVCLKQIMQPEQYPNCSGIVSKGLLQPSERVSTSCIIHNIVILLVGTSLTDGESLNTVSLTLSSLFGLPVSLNALRLHRPSFLHLFNNSLVQVTILNDNERREAEVLREKPDLLIVMYTDQSSFDSSAEILTWARDRELLSITVQLVLDHCINAKCRTSAAASISSYDSPVQEGVPKLHVLPLHHHLICFSFHLSSLYVDCLEKATSELTQSLIDCNRQRLKKAEAAVANGDIFGKLDTPAIYELDLFCL
ncbi:PREDICTED: uncharacterized protein LOC109580459 [Amphimedon queenslandica]|uniref:CARD domain-containing protein n=1 Tax=Amphimedon queenslandica TaxID=400682 RepID=A0A1X7VF73_AMPQE|nr:PREDICTED: uncharacterized protein LOC109580459 [Amphimedon queenslandica]|eukprot:XP_019849201.1 PREDICTED: uncharacterized protein LOC109580459 [Amphimedon queenslandica]